MSRSEVSLLAWCRDHRWTTRYIVGSTTVTLVVQVVQMVHR